MSSKPTVKYMENISEEGLINILELGEIEVDPGILEKVKAGDAFYQCRIAQSYLKNGFYPHAKAWCLLSTEKNHAPAQFMMGKLYADYILELSSGDNFKMAGEWFEKAYQNDKNMAYEIGQYYLKNCYYKESFKWLMKGAADGHYAAQFYVGKFFNREVCTTYIALDKIKAMEWFQKSADQGYENAINKVKQFNKEGYYSIYEKERVLPAKSPVKETELIKK